MTLSFTPDAIETWPLSRLQPYAKNAKLHGPDQVAKLAASMAEFGWTVPCLVGEDGELIAGHGRVLAATQLGLIEAPVIVLGHLTEAQRRAYRIADNKLTELGTWDEALLSAELNDLLAEDFDLSLVGFTDGELDKLLAFDPDGGGEEEGGAGGSVPPVTIPEPPRNPASRTGDLWILGDHRLLCGDSTSHDDVRRLMNGERAVLFATDPPYLVDYDGSNHPTRNKDWSQSYGVTWDDSSQGADLYDGFIAAAVAEAITKDAAWYCWHASRRQAMLEACWEKAGVVSTPSSPERAAQVFRRAQGLISRHGSGGDRLPGLRVLAGRDDGMGTAICNRIVAFARVVGAISRNATDFLVLRDLVEKVG